MNSWLYLLKNLIREHKTFVNMNGFSDWDYRPVKGVVFKSPHHYNTYLIEVILGEVLIEVVIYKFNPYDLGLNPNDLVTGQEIHLEYVYPDPIATLRMSYKYFILKMDDLQLYYDDKKHYGHEKESNEIIAIMECIDYAVDHAIVVANIKPN